MNDQARRIASRLDRLTAAVAEAYHGLAAGGTTPKPWEQRAYRELWGKVNSFDTELALVLRDLKSVEHYWQMQKDQVAHAPREARYRAAQAADSHLKGARLARDKAARVAEMLRDLMRRGSTWTDTELIQEVHDLLEQFGTRIDETSTMSTLASIGHHPAIVAGRSNDLRAVDAMTQLWVLSAFITLSIRKAFQSTKPK